MIYSSKLGKIETIAKLAFTSSLLLVLTISGIGLYAQTSPTNNMTKYTDPQGRLSINYPYNWTPLTSTNPFQQRVVQFIKMVPFVNFNIVITPEPLARKILRQFSMHITYFLLLGQGIQYLKTSNVQNTI